MTWREFRDNADTYDNPVPPAVQEQADDAKYAADFAALVAIYRGDGSRRPVTNGVVAADLRALAVVLLALHAGWGVPTTDAIFARQCCEDHGPAFQLRALARAYELEGK